jgi:hypothetical protein
MKDPDIFPGPRLGRMSRQHVNDGVGLIL